MPRRWSVPPWCSSITRHSGPQPRHRTSAHPGTFALHCELPIHSGHRNREHTRDVLTEYRFAEGETHGRKVHRGAGGHQLAGDGVDGVEADQEMPISARVTGCQVAVALVFLAPAHDLEAGYVPEVAKRIDGIGVPHQ